MDGGAGAAADFVDEQWIDAIMYAHRNGIGMPASGVFVEHSFSCRNQHVNHDNQ